MTEIESFVATYGYLAVFAGTLLEGETVLVAAGLAAHQGLLDLHYVILVAIVGGTLGDQLAFLLGRWKGEALISRFALLSERKQQVHALLERYDALLILSIRFIYGLRIAGPVVLGTSRIPIVRFALFNSIGAVIWAILIAGAGYSFGAAIHTLLDHVQAAEEILLALLVVVVLGVWWWRTKR